MIEICFLSSIFTFIKHRSADKLKYYYSGNRLIAVDDAQTGQNAMRDFTDNGHKYTIWNLPEFRYDLNGNMIEDINRDIKVDYIQGLSLPKRITFPEGYIANGYFYDGVKYSKTRFDNNSNLLEEEKYFGNLVIRNGRPFRILHNEGYVDLTDLGQIDQKYYHIKDHLGNVRVVIQDYNNSYLINQVSTYYPFGMVLQPERFVNSQDETDNAYLYNGKEQQEMPGGGYDYGARFYDAQLGRWHVLDNLADKYFHLSPNSYAANNPILFVDPDGQKIVIGNNTSKALTNLAKIAATSKGRQRLNRLISSRHTYTTQSTFWSKSSAYDPYGKKGAARSIYYVGSAWRPKVSLRYGGAMSSMYAMGHELNHAYDNDITGHGGLNEIKARETSSVNFTNYLRSVHGDGDDLRTNYSGLGLNFSNRESTYNSQGEKVTDFTQTLDVSTSGNTFMGFSYETSTKGEEEQASHVISVKTESGEYAYRVFDNQNDYDAAVERINNLKTNGDEKK